MALERANPYIWVTWLSSLMTGENPCQWLPWFRANYQLQTEQPSDFDLVSWKVSHTRMLTELGDDLEQRDGALIQTEVELKHYFEDYGGTLAGKADCICREPGQITIFDCKTGKERDSDQAQVLIYMWLLSQNPQTADRTIRGEVVYSERRSVIERIPESFENDMRFFIKLICSKKPPRRTPGNACRFCKITKDDCADRVD
jgi:hypothetical protein